jgi:Holliday junction resolvasome RuvABC ATP-dependent DNA helicase subunit
MFGNIENTLWTEYYRPTTLDGYVGNEHIISKVKIYLESGDVPHLLLHGTAGVGKCLDFSERVNIEIELSDEEAEKLRMYIQK